MPFFVYGPHRYWGNDRLEWLLRDIAIDLGKSVPDSKNDVFSGLFSFDGDVKTD